MPDKPAFDMNGWCQGVPQVFLGRRRAFDATAVSRVGQTQATMPAEPASTSIEPVWLFGRKTRE